MPSAEASAKKTSKAPLPPVVPSRARVVVPPGAHRGRSWRRCRRPRAARRCRRTPGCRPRTWRRRTRPRRRSPRSARPRRAPSRNGSRLRRRPRARTRSASRPISRAAVLPLTSPLPSRAAPRPALTAGHAPINTTRNSMSRAHAWFGFRRNREGFLNPNSLNSISSNSCSTASASRRACWRGRTDLYAETAKSGRDGNETTEGS